jgi:CheY-like chemotaxis protein
MQASAERGAEVVRQVLGFVRGGDAERSEISLLPILHEIEGIVRETFPKLIHLRASLPNELWSIVANRTQVHQVLMNLAVNARDAIAGQGTITLSAKNTTLDEAYTRMNPEAKPLRYVVVTVEDTGTGMSDAMLERVFDPFFTTKGVGKGTGLGLSTSRAIVTDHGGFINVHSEPNKGSSFQVYFPATVSRQPLTPAKAVEDMPMGDGEMILVVDDEAAVREITKQILESHGYRVMTVDDGTEALTAFSEHHNRIALLLIDMIMPYLDGKATIRAIRKQNPTVKIIATSGLAPIRGTPGTRPPGVAAFLPKPYTASDLLQAVRSVLTTD